MVRWAMWAGVWWLAAIFAGAGAPACGMEAGKLLPADGGLIVTLNLGRLLADHRDTPFVQRYLDQFRLARKGDLGQLKDYYRRENLRNFEGISEDDFLARAKMIQSISGAFDVNPLEDLDQITWASSGIVIVEGRFQVGKFKPALERIGKEYFGSCKLAPPGEVWQVPARTGGRFVALVDERTLVIADSRPALDALLARAQGKQQDGLAGGTRRLLDALRTEHISLLIGDADRRSDELARFLKEDVARAINTDGPVAKFIVTQGADALRKYGKDISSAGVGLSLREDELRLQLGLDAKKRGPAKELHEQIVAGNLFGGLALKTSENKLAQGLADVLLRQRVTLKETTLTTRTEVPYDFVKLAATGPWLALWSKDLAPANPDGAKTAATQAAFDAISTRITSVPLWTLPGVNADVLELRDLAYQSEAADPVRHRLDLYLPKGVKSFPVLVLVHGGAWSVGDNRSAGLYPSVAEFLAGRGIGVVMPNYRLFPGVKHPEPAKDVARAVAWTRANIARHGGDPKRLFLSGHSAGGHLAALLAADESYLRAEGMSPADLRGVIAVSGVYRIPPGPMSLCVGGGGPRALWPDQMWPMRGDSAPSIRRWVPGLPITINLFAPIFGDDPRQCERASPLFHVRKNMPPMLLLTAEHDLPTLGAMADEFHKALAKNGCDARLLQLDKRNHNSLMFSAIRPDDPAARAILQFIRKTQ